MPTSLSEDMDMNRFLKMIVEKVKYIHDLKLSSGKGKKR